MNNNDVFLNIIILFSANYKKINLLDQFTAFYKTIKLNLKSISYDISIVHFEDFNNEDLNKLKKLDVNLIKTSSNRIIECSLERYIVKTKVKGTHRLIAETDMLLLKEPKFNWNVDFQKMYGKYSKTFPPNIMNNIYKMFNIKNKYIQNYNKNCNLFVSYNIKKISKNKLFPHFNNGLTLIKEDFSQKFYQKMISIDFIKRRNHFPSRYHHFYGQILYSLILLELTDNWEPFKPGINYLLKVYNINKFGKENISLLHYCGSGGGKLVKKHFSNHFL